MSTSVPSPTFGATGFVPQPESAILTGVQTDQQTAFGGALNPGLTTPQGQLAQSLTAIIGDVQDQFCALANGVDPAFASGRMQDAIGRIYFLTRNPALPTVVTATLTGLAGTVIPINAKAVDQAGNVYLCTQAGTIGGGGTVSLTFACSVTGPVACPIGFLNAIYQAIPGWDTITNPAAGVQGVNVESRADFEFRRQNSVALNAIGSLASVYAAVLSVNGVIDAYASENSTSVNNGASFTGSIAGSVLTVTAVASGTIKLNDMVGGAGVLTGTLIQSFGTGTGGVGTYNLSISQTVGSVSMTAAPGGFALVPYSIYVAAYGGTDADVANAIFLKKMPGCNYNGNTTVSVQQTANYSPPYPTYSVTFQRPIATAIKFAVTMQNNAQVPSGAAALVQAAIVAAFNGSDGGARARIGSAIFASRFYAGIAALGPWALIISIQLGVGTADQNSVLMPINQIPTVTTGDITVTFA